MPSDPSDITIHEIHSSQDPAWEGWKRLYLASFPENERMSLPFFEKLLARKAAGEAPGSHVLTLTLSDDPSEVTGLSFHEVDGDPPTGFLWYVAISPAERSRGLGARFYAELVRRIQEAGAGLLLFEVEMPELAAEESADWARRRIAWYQRQGARLLGGVEYFQSVDGPSEPVQMHVMAQPLVPMTAEAVYGAAAGLFGDAIRQIGPLTLT